MSTPEHLRRAIQLINDYDTTETITSIILDAAQTEQPQLIAETLLNIARKKLENDQNPEYVLAEAETIYTQLNDRNHLADTYSLRAAYLRDLDDEKAYSLLSRANTLYEATGAEPLQAETLYKMAQISHEYEEYEQAQQEYLQANILADTNNQPELSVKCLHARAKLYNETGDPIEARRLLETAYQQSTKLPQQTQTAHILNDQALDSFKQGDNQRALTRYTEAYNIYHDTDDNYHAGLSKLGTGYAQLNLDQNPEAEQSFKESLDRIHASENQFILPSAYRGLAIALERQGKREEAKEALRNAQELEG